MKFSVATLLVLVPLVSQAAAVSVPRLTLRQNQFNKGQQRGSNFGGGRNGNSGSSSIAAVSSTASASASASATVAATSAAASSTAAANTTAAATGDPQTSLTLDPRVIASGFAKDGQDVPTAGQVSSLTSTNNFINFCLLGNLPITNGKQITTGSCNPAPIGSIPSVSKMPSAKFTFPKNGGTVIADTEFKITMNINNLVTGNFVNAQENYFAAPQQLDSTGTIIGHSHVVVEALTAIDQTTPTDPTKFAFFKGLNDAAVGGALTADVTSGLPAGAYRLCSINSCANHQPAIVPVAQHGSLDDCIYFTSTADGAAASTGAAAVASTAAAAAASTTAAASATAGAAATSAAAASQTAKASTKGNNNKSGKGRRFINRL
ncbi:hypothetical protein C0991_010823 [Blastosporella zonata]|nr:hypothetical protein C0991_010823 [Blastosporella zonata]